MMRRMLLAGCALALVAAPASAWAQSAGPDPSAGPDQKVDALVRSLQPRPGQAGATRGIRPIGSAVSAARTAPPSASLQVDFDSGSDTLRPGSLRTLDTLGQALNAPKLAADRFRIEGHTDTVGTDPVNLDLSERRAKAVAAYLSDHYQIPGARLEVVGMGKKGLAVPTGDDVPEARNRRVKVVNIGS